ncbi:very short patch repair endonuclease [Nibrella viscosa]|uniref:very short patch repair endonuclease n=1 Tax=Nibrella viscosa TaxID=1084524 RepID=UPI0031ED0199
MDKLTPDERSRVMAKVKNANTTPELLVRRLLHRMGYRFKLNDKKLAGSPDIVLPRHRKVIFVHGCFWHGHDCVRGKRPTTRVEFWNAKIDRNIERDRLALDTLATAGWKVLIIWECWTKSSQQLQQLLSDFMQS